LNQNKKFRNQIEIKTMTFGVIVTRGIVVLMGPSCTS